MENTENQKEILRIRKKFKSSRKQFAEVFLLGMSASQMYYYEDGRSKIPPRIMRIVKKWEKFYDALKEESKR